MPEVIDNTGVTFTAEEYGVVLMNIERIVTHLKNLPGAHEATVWIAERFQREMIEKGPK